MLESQYFIHFCKVDLIKINIISSLDYYLRYKLKRTW